MKEPYEIIIDDGKEFIEKNSFPFCAASIQYLKQPKDPSVGRLAFVQVAGYNIFLYLIGTFADGKHWVEFPKAVTAYNRDLTAMADWYLREVISKDLEKYQPFAL